MNSFYLYILKCADNSYYVGHTDDIELRIAQHISGEYICYTTNRRPLAVVFVQDFASRDEALAAERQIKNWSRRKKEALIKKYYEKLKYFSKKNFTE